MKKVLIILLLALCATFAYGQAVNAITVNTSPSLGAACGNDKLVIARDSGEHFACTGGVWVHRPKGEPASYLLYNAGSTYVLKSLNGAAPVSGTDPGALLQTAIDALASTGGTIVLRSGDTFTYTSTTPKFGPGNANWVTVSGYGAKIVLAQAAPRAFAFKKTSDYQTIQMVRLEGVTIDGNNLTGRYSVIGTYFNGSDDLNRTSYSNIHIRDVKIFNVRTDPNTGTNHWGMIKLPLVFAGGETTPITASNIIIERVHTQGGNWGFLLTTGAQAPLYAKYSDIIFRDNVIDMRPAGAQIQSTFIPSTGIHVASYGLLENVMLVNNTVYAPGDNCFEVNNAMDAKITDNSCYNPIVTGLTLCNFTALPRVDAQRYDISGLKVTVNGDFAWDGTQRSVSAVSGSVNNDMGSVNIRNSAIVWEGTRSWGVMGRFTAFGGTGSVRDLTITDSQMVMEDYQRNVAYDNYSYPIQFEVVKGDWDNDGSRDDLPRLRIDNFTAHMTYTEQPTKLTSIRFVGVLKDGDVSLTNSSFVINTNADNDWNALFIGGYGPTYSQKVFVDNISIGGTYPNLVTKRVAVFVQPGSGTEANLASDAIFSNVDAPDFTISPDISFRDKIVVTGKVSGGSIASVNMTRDFAVDDTGPVIDHVVANGSTDHRQHLLFGPRDYQKLLISEDSNAIFNLSRLMWNNPATDVWEQPYTATIAPSKLVWSYDGSLRFDFVPYQSRSAGTDLTSAIKTAFISKLADDDGDGTLDDARFGVGNTTALAGTIQATADYSQIPAFLANKTNQAGDWVPVLWGGTAPTFGLWYDINANFAIASRVKWDETNNTWDAVSTATYGAGKLEFNYTTGYYTLGHWARKAYTAGDALTFTTDLYMDNDGTDNSTKIRVGDTTAAETQGMEFADGKALGFEGATENAYETKIDVVDPTNDQTFTLPNATGRAVISSGAASNGGGVHWATGTVTCTAVCTTNLGQAGCSQAYHLNTGTGAWTPSTCADATNETKLCMCY